MTGRERLLIKLLKENKLKEHYTVNLDFCSYCLKHNVYPVISNNYVSTLTTRCNSVVILRGDEVSKLRIRKLTPKECWRLMGFDDKDFERAAEVNSNTQLYKQAGNSIVVNVLERILNNLLNVSNS